MQSRVRSRDVSLRLEPALALGRPHEELRAGAFPWLQLLTHPEIWVYPGTRWARRCARCSRRRRSAGWSSSPRTGSTCDERALLSGDVTSRARRRRMLTSARTSLSASATRFVDRSARGAPRCTHCSSTSSESASTAHRAFSASTSTGARSSPSSKASRRTRRCPRRRRAGELGLLLRRMHEAQAGFVPPERAMATLSRGGTDQER